MATYPNLADKSPGDVALSAEANDIKDALVDGTKSIKPASIVPSVSSDPGTPEEGETWYNSTDNLLRYYNGTDTIDIEPGVKLVSSDPGSPTAGEVWYNTTSNVLKYYDGTNTHTLVDHSTTATVTAATGDLIPVFDVSDSSNPKKVTAQSIADLTTGADTWFATPGSATYPDSNFPGLSKEGTNYIYYQLAYDQTTTETAYWNLEALGTSATIYLYWKAPAATTGDVVWGTTMRSVGEGDSWDAAGTTTDSAADTTQGTAGNVTVTSVTNSATLTIGEWVQMSIFRDTADSGDTLAEDAHLLGIKVVFA